MPIERMKEGDKIIDLANTAFELIGRINRLASGYERRVYDLESAASSTPSGPSVEQFKKLEAQLEEAFRSNQTLSGKISELELQRDVANSGQAALVSKLNMAEASCSQLQTALDSETTRLRARRHGFGRYQKMVAYHRVADRAQKILDRHKAQAEAVKASRPKLLEYNQALGNALMLEALVADGQISLLADGVQERVVVVAAELKEEILKIDIPDLNPGDFDISSIFAEPFPDPPEWVPSPGVADDSDSEFEGGAYNRSERAPVRMGKPRKKILFL
ncbi:PREDICTED: uncharacterized protein LOC104789775 isoform X2 [Camelina sativa]|uniref:Uncharacterized protein LOC104789775 isoform X2 n=1 Tax=Camelina sativa TaxID=90675 RepID=A0ABM0ZCC5_CAMSA|nr:PREDICTED: uncharacterized protein LOC104789775 isoform X2 [Camelina sativa]